MTAKRLHAAKKLLQRYAEAVGNLRRRAQRKIFLPRLNLAHIGFRHMSHVGKLPLGYALGHANIANTTADFALNIFHGPKANAPWKTSFGYI